MIALAQGFQCRDHSTHLISLSHTRHVQHYDRDVRLSSYRAEKLVAVFDSGRLTRTAT
jgi:hypothetical protein